MSAVSYAQSQDRQHVKTGNRYFRVGNFDKSGAEYMKALDKNPSNAQALYNYGCVMIMQNQDSAAIEYFTEASRVERNKFRKSKSFHNIGFICQRLQMYDEAIEAYKESLRLNPNDDETRYNLALCQKNRKNQNGGQSDNNKNDDEGKDKNKENEKKKPDEGNQNNPQQKKEKISKDNAEPAFPGEEN